MNRQPTRIFTNAAVVILSTVLSLDFTEILYQPFESLEQRNIQYAQNQYAFYRYNSVLGWVNNPNTKGRLQHAEFNTKVKINSDGMRYHEVGPKKAYRIAVLGDSFTWGLGVEQDQRFTDLLENKLGIELLNFGVSGHAPVQYYLELDYILKFKPDMVLLVFCPQNDFAENIMDFTYSHYRPYASLENGKLLFKGYPIPRSSYGKSLLAKPYIVKFALGRLAYSAWNDVKNWWTHESSKDTHEVSNFIYAEPPLAQLSDALTVNEALLKAIRDKLAKQKIPLVIFAAPGKRDIHNDIAINYLKASTARLGLHLATYQGTLGLENFFISDAHWNVAGHQKIAETLQPVIISFLP